MNPERDEHARRHQQQDRIQPDQRGQRDRQADQHRPRSAQDPPAEIEQRPGDDAGDDRPDPMQHPAEEHGGRELPIEPGEPEHDRHCRADEDTAGDHQPGNPGALVAEQDGELGRGRTRDQLTGGEVFEEDALIEPAPSIDHLAAHQGDVRDRPAEGDQTQLGEDACDFTEGPAQVAIDARRFPSPSGEGRVAATSR